MERQRHLEWEKQRIQDLETRLNKELEYVTSIRIKNTSLNNEYQSLVCSVVFFRQHFFNMNSGTILNSSLICCSVIKFVNYHSRLVKRETV